MWEMGEFQVVTFGDGKGGAEKGRNDFGNNKNSATFAVPKTMWIDLVCLQPR